MRNPYNKYYYDFDEICVVKNQLELQLVMNFMIGFDIDCDAIDFARGIPGQRFIVVPKGNLTKADLKEARDSTSGIIWALNVGLTEETKAALKEKKL